jgi:hypothetical protein
VKWFGRMGHLHEHFWMTPFFDFEFLVRFYFVGHFDLEFFSRELWVIFKNLVYGGFFGFLCWWIVSDLKG